METCATLIFEAATIFMALVIFWMLVTDLIRCFTVARVASQQQHPEMHITFAQTCSAYESMQLAIRVELLKS